MNNENPVENQSNEEVVFEKAYRFAGFWMRFWAYLFDLFVVASINRIIVVPIGRAFSLNEIQFVFISLQAILITVITLSYFVVMTKFFNQTIGKMLFGLKVISKDDQKLTWISIIFREVIGRYIVKTLFNFLYLVVAFHPKKQGIHDIFSDTYVIHEQELNSKTIIKLKQQPQT